MKIWRCDRCGKQEEPIDGQEYIQNWDVVTISSLPAYDLCEPCAKELFAFLAAK